MTEAERLRRGLPLQARRFLRHIVGEEPDGDDLLRPILSCGHAASSAPTDDPRLRRLCRSCVRGDAAIPIDPEAIARRYQRILRPFDGAR